MDRAEIGVEELSVEELVRPPSEDEARPTLAADQGAARLVGRQNRFSIRNRA